MQFESFSLIGRHSSVAALVPHFRCEHWLVDCLDSLISQTRPLQAIIVIDDASDPPPTETVQQFPSVSLLASEENVGPYRLIQQVITNTHFDAYLLNDADDWSLDARLSILLDAAEREGAQMVGSQAVRLHCAEGEAISACYPTDVNAALVRNPISHALLHGSSILSRELVMRIGGFSTALKFSADSEFLWRAAHIARIINVPQYCYFRRIWSGALTVAPETGLQSMARRNVRSLLRERAAQNVAATKEGGQPNLTPMSVAPPIKLSHVCGPELRDASVNDKLFAPARHE